MWCTLMVTLSHGLLTKQPFVDVSSTEAKYIAILWDEVQSSKHKTVTPLPYILTLPFVILYLTRVNGSARYGVCDVHLLALITYVQNS